MATNLEVFLEGTMTGLAALLTLVAMASAKRAGSRRAWMIGLAFAVFAVKGLLLLAGRFEQDVALNVLDLAVLGLLYTGLLSG